MTDARHEVDEARRYDIPIIVLVDTNKQLAREVIDKYMELGFSWLFDEQARALVDAPFFFAEMIVAMFCVWSIGHRVFNPREGYGVSTLLQGDPPCDSVLCSE